MRIVSLACSNTEIVCALGCEDLLVGVDDHSDHPVEVVAPLPRVGPDLEIDIDRVEALKPDLVLATLTVPGHERVVEGLESRGLPFIAPEPTSLSDVLSNIRTIAKHLGVSGRAEDLCAELKATWGDADGRESGPGPAADAPALLVQWWPKPVISPGRLSWTTDVIERAGGSNPIGSEPVKSRPLEDSEVAELSPDAIVLSWCGVDPAKYRPDVVYRNQAWRELPAIRDRRVFCVPEAYLGRPGPRLVDGLRELRSIVEELKGDGLASPSAPATPPARQADP